MNIINRISFNKKNHYLYLLIICILAVFFRMYHIGFQSLWLDELYTVIPTNPVSSLSSVIDYCKSDQPPAYFILVYYIFKLFGYNELYGRILSAIIGVLGVLSIYHLGKECKDQNVGLFASTITSVNYLHIIHSQEVRFYSLLFLSAVLSFLFFIRCYKKPHFLNFLFYTLSNILIIYTHYYGLIVMLAQAIIVVVLFIVKKYNRFLLYYIISGALTVVAYVPWLSTVVYDLGITQTWLTKPSLLKLGEYFYNYFGKEPVQTLLYLFFIGLFIRETIKIKNTNNEKKHIYLILILWIILTYAIPFIRSTFDTPILLLRYTLITLPGLIVLFGIGWSVITRDKLKVSFLLIIVIASFINLFFVNAYYSKVRNTQFREIAYAVVKNNEDNYSIYSDKYWFFNYYFEKYGSRNKVINASISNMPLEMKDKKGVWILEAHDKNWTLPEFLTKEFKLTKEINYKTASAKLYLRTIN